MHLAPLIVSIIMLILALPAGWPYGYYTLLRFAVCGTAVYLAIVCYAKKKTGWVYGLGLLAVLFNPLAVIHLEKTVWMFIDLMTAGVFVYLLIKHWKPERR